MTFPIDKDEGTGGFKMTKEREAWDQFLATGRVEDYLACVGKGSPDKSAEEENPDTEGQQEDVLRDGEGSAGLC